MVFRRIPQVRDAVVAIRAERKLKEVASGICQSMTPENLRTLARNNISLLTILQETGRTVPTPSATQQRGINYLTSLATPRLLRILNEVIPEHIAVLREFPDYADSIANDLKVIAAGQPLTS